MTSQVDFTVPPEGMALTADVRANFKTIYDEISALQDNGGDFLPLTGGTLTGPLTIGDATVGGLNITPGYPLTITSLRSGNDINLDLTSSSSSELKIYHGSTTSYIFQKQQLTICAGGGGGITFYSGNISSVAQMFGPPAGIQFSGKTAFFGATPIDKPDVTGSHSDNPALMSLLNALAAFGLITNSTTS